MHTALSVSHRSHSLYDAWLPPGSSSLSPLSFFAAPAFEFYAAISVQSHTPLYKRVFLKAADSAACRASRGEELLSRLSRLPLLLMATPTARRLSGLGVTVITTVFRKREEKKSAFRCFASHLIGGALIDFYLVDQIAGSTELHSLPLSNHTSRNAWNPCPQGRTLAINPTTTNPNPK